MCPLSIVVETLIRYASFNAAINSCHLITSLLLQLKSIQSFTYFLWFCRNAAQMSIVFSFNASNTSQRKRLISLQKKFQIFYWTGKNEKWANTLYVSRQQPAASSDCECECQRCNSIERRRHSTHLRDFNWIVFFLNGFSYISTLKPSYECIKDERDMLIWICVTIFFFSFKEKWKRKEKHQMWLCIEHHLQICNKRTIVISSWICFFLFSVPKPKQDIRICE